jgi:hypothetical protein
MRDLMRKSVLVFLVSIGARSSLSQQASSLTEGGRPIYKVGAKGVEPPHPNNNVKAEFSPQTRAKQINGHMEFAGAAPTN